MKNFMKPLAVIGLMAVGVACENKSSNTRPQPVGTSAEISQFPSRGALVGGGTILIPQTALVASGGTVKTSTVIDYHLVALIKTANPETTGVAIEVPLII